MSPISISSISRVTSSSRIILAFSTILSLRRDPRNTQSWPSLWPKMDHAILAVSEGFSVPATFVNTLISPDPAASRDRAGSEHSTERTRGGRRKGPAGARGTRPGGGRREQLKAVGGVKRCGGTMDFAKNLPASKTAAERLPGGRAAGDSTVARRVSPPSCGGRLHRRGSTVARRRNPSSEACDFT